MDPNNTHEVIFWDNLYKLRPWLIKFNFIKSVTTKRTDSTDRQTDAIQSDPYTVCLFTIKPLQF